jgi:hypothetical protein
MHVTTQPLDIETNNLETTTYCKLIGCVVTIHLTPLIEEEIRQEVEEVASELGANIRLGREGIRISV